MRYFKKLVGKNVYLSPMNIEDLEIYTKWLNDFSVTDGLGMSGILTTLTTEKEYLEKNTKEGYNFAIVKIEDDTLIGNCSFHNLDFIRQTGTVGIMIGEESERNKGYGTEILNLLLDYGFNYLNLHNIDLGVYSFNERAIACYKKVGFKEYGRRREAIYLKNKRHDAILMDILKEEFNNSKSN